MQSAVVAKLEIAGTIIYSSPLANKLLNHFEVSNLSFSIFCLSAGGGAAGASLMGAPALLGLLPQGGLIQASKEVGSHHNKKRGWLKYSSQENFYLISDVHVVDNNRTNMEMLYQSWDQYAHHASRAFLFLAQFWFTQERLCMDPVRPFLSRCLMLLRYSSEPRPNSCCLFQRAQLWTSVYQWTDAHTRKTSLMREKQEWLVKKFMLLVVVAVWERWGLSVDTVITKESEELNNRVLLGDLFFSCIVSFVVCNLYLGIYLQCTEGTERWLHFILDVLYTVEALLG